MASRSRRKRASSRRPRQRRQAWKGVVALLVIVTAALAVNAWCSRRDGSDSVAGPTAQPGARHYADLELAQPADGRDSGHTERIRYTGFTMDFNTSNLTPDWVGWELTGAESEGSVSRSDKFWGDPAVAGSPQPSDYRKSGWDKGHLCPAADQKWSEEAMHDCFVMTNMAPQDHSLNTGAWQTLERKERLWAKRDSAIVIVAGPIYTDSDRQRIGESGVRVPSAFYKVLLAPYVEHPRAIGFIYPNMTSPGNMADYSMSVDEVERITGLDFFYNLPDDIEEKVERSASFREWNMQ